MYFNTIVLVQYALQTIVVQSNTFKATVTVFCNKMLSKWHEMAVVQNTPVITPLQHTLVHCVTFAADMQCSVTQLL